MTLYKVRFINIRYL